MRDIQVKFTPLASKRLGANRRLIKSMIGRRKENARAPGGCAILDYNRTCDRNHRVRPIGGSAPRWGLGELGTNRGRGVWLRFGAGVFQDSHDDHRGEYGGDQRRGTILEPCHDHGRSHSPGEFRATDGSESSLCHRR